MNNTDRKVTFELDNVVVSIAGPLKDEAAFVGKFLIVEEQHGPDIEWKPVKLKSDDSLNESPVSENLDWEDVASTGTVNYKANHNDSVDAVEIKAVRMPKDIKFDISDLNSFKAEISDSQVTVLTFLLKDGTNIPSFQINTQEFGKLCAALDHYVHFKKSKKESNLYLMVDPKVEALEKSFSELDLFSDSKSHIITKLMHDPVNTAMGGFSKVTNFLLDYMVFPNEPEDYSSYPVEKMTEIMTSNVLKYDINQDEEPGYELITCIELPSRPEVEREEPVTLEEFNSHFDVDGNINTVDELKRRIFKGGLQHAARSDAWKYLLNFYTFDSNNRSRGSVKKKKTEDYYRMKLQWKSFDADQESRFSALRERKSLIEKDVSRTDRTHPYFEGENNINVQYLQDVLTTYCMYNFDLGYVQGMSDLLSPILVVMQNEIDAFWCFAGWLQDIGVNFELEQQGMKNQLRDLHRLLHFVDSQLCSYLERHDSGNMYFAFRWLLILFKRDFKFMDIMRLWEVLWTGLPCKNFHLLICIAILDTEKLTIMENKYGLTEILKHVNEMSYKIDLDKTLCKAEAIYLQIKNSKYRSDVVEDILGLEHIPKAPILSQESPVKQVSPKRDASSKKKPYGVSFDNVDEFVDLEHNYQWTLDPFS